MPQTSIPALFDALLFASEKHRDQRRKGSVAPPYINHPIAVAHMLANTAGVSDPDVLMAALLHDTIEDTQATAAELEARFGARVTALVLEVTDDKSLPKADRKRLQIEHASTLSHEARQIKLADKICNLRDMATSPPPDWPLERVQDYFDWAAAVVNGLRGTNRALESAFDAAHALRPVQV